MHNKSLAADKQFHDRMPGLQRLHSVQDRFRFGALGNPNSTQPS
jgi:hypothetical protein